MGATLRIEAFEGALAERLRGRPEAGLALFWLGQAGFVLDTPAARLVIDPYLSDSLAEKYRGTRFPHRRMMPAPVSLEDLGAVDLVLCTHQHTDHMDPGTLPRIAARHPHCRFVVPAAAQDEAIRRIGVTKERLIPVDAGERIHPLSGLAITPTRAAHETLERDAQGRHRFLGYAIEAEDVRVWHSGDGIPFAGHGEEIRALAPDLALLPVNGRDAERAGNGVPGNYRLDEAIALMAEAGIPLALGHHYGLFAFNTEDPGRIDAAAAGQPGFERARLGMAYRLSAA